MNRRIVTRRLRFVGAPGSRSIERMARPAGLILDYGQFEGPDALERLQALIR